MRIPDESVDNFRRAAVDDAMLGILNLVDENIHLALVKPRNGTVITEERYSVISSVRRDPLEGQGGHAQLAGFAGVAGVEQEGVGPGVGQAGGVSVMKKGVKNLQIR